MTERTAYNYRVLRVDGSETHHSVHMEKPPTLAELKAVVRPYLDGAPMEHVRVLQVNGPADMFVDDVGVMKGLPVNEAATTIYRRQWLANHPEDVPGSLPHIAGTAVIFDKIVWS